ncbi:hypothetical protein BCR34DRAFT_66490 [Clohesyomyces aquaticus]|uniref:Uncharacterized protein n=1 Tax=Clohesyomyces aquaticus TaxID=1231657 RepID=A0A1Y1Z0P2_9PLEO|nr:hypothetical protein BCR34DRAFT_66490 [Clohesyomyces aquaticus]
MPDTAGMDVASLGRGRHGLDLVFCSRARWTAWTWAAPACRLWHVWRLPNQPSTATVTSPGEQCGQPAHAIRTSSKTPAQQLSRPQLMLFSNIHTPIHLHLHIYDDCTTRLQDNSSLVRVSGGKCPFPPALPAFSPRLAVWLVCWDRRCDVLCRPAPAQR